MRGEQAPEIGAASAAGTVTEPAPAAASLEAVAVALPPSLPTLTRAEAASLLVAGLAHAGLMLALVAPSSRIGAGGLDFEAIGIEIVTVAPALEARSSARGRGEAAAARPVDESDGDSIPAP